MPAESVLTKRVPNTEPNLPDQSAPASLIRAPLASPKTYSVAVRALCEFTAKTGDLDLRFTPSPTASDGIEGHQLVAKRRAENYQTEITLSGAWKSLIVRGRADGYDPDANRLEEIKTYRGDLASMKSNRRALHWAQAKIYAWLLCQRLDISSIEVALVYFNIDSKEETVLAETCDAGVLREFFELHCERFETWALQEIAHRESRNSGLAAMTFPHGEFRVGQRELAEAVYKTAANARTLLAQAPTGIGKTMGTLFPTLKAMPKRGLDKIFFLAAKTSGRRIAIDALARLKTDAHSERIRVIELVARDKSCEYPDRACHGDSCPLAKGFYDRLAAAREITIAKGAWATEDLRKVALAHEICPYYLTQDMALWSDVVVADYNYYFDSTAMLHGMAAAREWKAALLIDEAHNLVDRARKMYSVELSPRKLEEAMGVAPESLREPMKKLARAWSSIDREQADEYRVLDEIPKSLQGSMQQVCERLMEHEAMDDAMDQAAPLDPKLMDFFFEMLQFTRLAEQFDSHSVFDITLVGRSSASRKKPLSILGIKNLVPAPFLRERFRDANSAVLFSATLSPANYYSSLLGLPENTATVDVASPFTTEQLKVSIALNISTRYSDRKRSLTPMARLMAQQYREKPGNYLAFLSSYEYLDQVADALCLEEGGIEVWRQSRSMSEKDRDAFLSRFIEGGKGIGFAVLGGPFAEGVDLPGSRLIGAFIATLGLPQMNETNEKLKSRMHEMFGEGYNYAYLYPGLQKVVQAAGRVIRSPEDDGVIHLMDDRYGHREVRALLPKWWSLSR